MPRKNRLLALSTASFALVAQLVLGAAPSPAADLLLILDASGSMWGQVDGENKIVIARRALGDLLADLPEDSEVGLVAYGHRREGDCADVETVAPIAALDRDALRAVAEGLNPKGKTPITAAIEQSVELLRQRGEATTVVLLSDGLETCGGDPCAAVRAARQAGVSFVFHVIGFDVAKEDVSQLECAAQAGGGLYFDAQGADELAAALDRATTAPAEQPSGAIAIRATADGGPVDALVRVSTRDPEAEPIAGRTYLGEGTNPRVFHLPDGTYDVEVSPVRISGAAPRRFEGLVVREGETTSRTADFSSGELAILVTRNGELSDATVHAYPRGTTKSAASGRTYRAASSNPRVFKLAAGIYDVEIGSVEISGSPSIRHEGIEVLGGERVERSHDFESAELAVGAVSGEDLVDAGVAILDASGKEVAAGRTYTAATSNPKVFTVPPGTYRVVVKTLKLKPQLTRELEVTLTAGERGEHRVDFQAP